MQTLFATGSTFATNPYYNDTPFDGSTGGGVLDRLQYIQDEIMNSIVPVGSIQAFGGTNPLTIPHKWLLCDGNTLNAVTNPEYSELFSVIGNTYGGTNNTNFQLPDLRGRMIAGVDDITNNRIDDVLFPNNTTLGTVGGNDTTTLTIADMPAHDHGGTLTSTSSLGNHDHGTNTGDAGTHTHTITSDPSKADVALCANPFACPNTTLWNGVAASVYGYYSVPNITASSVGDHSHTISSANLSHTHNTTIPLEGSDTPFSNMPNFMTLNYIIKY